MARFEPDLREKITQEIEDSTKPLRAKMDEEVGNFGETLRGLREKINEVELHMERHFVGKPDFNDFRQEWRNDMRELKTNVAAILGTKH